MFRVRAERQVTDYSTPDKKAFFNPAIERFDQSADSPYLTLHPRCGNPNGHSCRPNGMRPPGRRYSTETRLVLDLRHPGKCIVRLLPARWLLPGAVLASGRRRL